MLGVGLRSLAAHSFAHAATLGGSDEGAVANIDDVFDDVAKQGARGTRSVVGRLGRRRGREVRWAGVHRCGVGDTRCFFALVVVALDSTTPRDRTSENGRPEGSHKDASGPACRANVWPERSGPLGRDKTTKTGEEEEQGEEEEGDE